MNSLKNVYKSMKDILSQNKNRSPEFEANQLIELVLGKSRLNLGWNYQVDEQYRLKLLELCNKRKQGYPLQYILGSWQFFDINLEIGEGVLIPRGDTEDVCSAAFDYIDNLVYPNVLDLCSGSGAIALAIKKYCPEATVVAVEKYPKAYEYLLKNIKNTGLAVMPILGDVFDYDYKIEDETFDVIISNPPYINKNLEGKLQKEVSFEPSTALFADDEGMKFYKFISHYYKSAIKEGGYLIFEYGYDQAEKIRNLLFDEEYKIVKEIVDTSGNSRGIIVQKV